LPATVLLLSSSTILRILVNRQAEIETWIRELGTTVIDFWTNWVVEPTKQLIGTIRHSEESEVALMSRKSLTADMDSLERMVVDFAIDNPDTSGSNSTSGQLSAAEIEAVRHNVKQGDLTPVLKAYEQDLRTPFRGAIRGELVRALLIQIQKTKVDVEVAISGIDRLLKSQELVFGFVSLTPGILISAVVARWVAGVFSGRHRKSSKKKGQMMRRLRKVDKILTGSKGIRGGNDGCLDYKEHGLLLCEVHVLREDARRVVKREVWGEFKSDLEELVDVSIGVKTQLRVLDRIRW
jgi:nuclear-control-of-ATPase protein 2